jgi:HAD superfamily phosphoserine phosphatase-like hydrolase
MNKNKFQNDDVNIRLAVFDQDNTLLDGRFIFRAAEEMGFLPELIRTMEEEPDPVKRTSAIAHLLKGISLEQILKTADSIKLNSGAAETIRILKQRGFVTGIITDSYDVVANLIKEKTGADFSIGITLEFKDNAATGEIKIPSVYLKSEMSKCPHEYCKGHAFVNFAKENLIDPGKSLAVGDGENDVCMIKAAEIGIAFCSGSRLLNSEADVIISEKNLLKILDYI